MTFLLLKVCPSSILPQTVSVRTKGIIVPPRTSFLVPYSMSSLLPGVQSSANVNTDLVHSFTDTSDPSTTSADSGVPSSSPAAQPDGQGGEQANKSPPDASPSNPSPPPDVPTTTSIAAPTPSFGNGGSSGGGRHTGGGNGDDSSDTDSAVASTTTPSSDPAASDTNDNTQNNPQTSTFGGGDNSSSSTEAAPAAATSTPSTPDDESNTDPTSTLAAPPTSSTDSPSATTSIDSGRPNNRKAQFGGFGENNGSSSSAAPAPAAVTSTSSASASTPDAGGSDNGTFTPSGTTAFPADPTVSVDSSDQQLPSSTTDGNASSTIDSPPPTTSDNSDPVATGDPDSTSVPSLSSLTAPPAAFSPPGGGFGGHRDAIHGNFGTISLSTDLATTTSLSSSLGSLVTDATLSSADAAATGFSSGSVTSGNSIFHNDFLLVLTVYTIQPPLFRQLLVLQVDSEASVTTLTLVPLLLLVSSHLPQLPLTVQKLRLSLALVVVIALVHKIPLGPLPLLVLVAMPTVVLATVASEARKVHLLSMALPYPTQP